MTIHFDRPVGAAGDVKELEYVSALHQTDLIRMRTDGSIKDEDIRLFLMSRYGIDVTDEQVRNTILHGLGGGSGDDDCIDLMEMVAVLLIPILLKAAQVESLNAELHPKLVPPKEGLIDYVLKMILVDVTGNRFEKPLTASLVKSILLAYGERDLAEDDDLVQAMVDVAQPDDDNDGSSRINDEPLTLNLDSFARALTYDVKLYDTFNEIRLSSNFDDVFLTHNPKENRLLHAGDEEEATVATPSKTELERLREISQPIKQRFTAPAIDFTAATYRSKGLTVLLWASFVVTYFAYVWRQAEQESTQDCSDFEYQYDAPWSTNAKAINCEIAASFVKWLVIFTIASVYGLLFIGFGSVGNSVTTKVSLLPLIGLLVVFGFTFGPYKGTTGYDLPNSSFLRNVSLTLGMLVCALHLSHAIVLLCPPAMVRRVPFLQRLFAAGTITSEVHLKQASAQKVNGMVQNALDILKVKDRDRVVDTNFGQGLLSFSKYGRRFEQSGGYFWTWQRVFNNHLATREGVWFSARFIASNIAQFIVSIFVLLAGISLTKRVGDDYDNNSAKILVRNILDKAVLIKVDESQVSEVTANMTQVVSDYLIEQTYRTCSNYLSTLGDACNYVSGVYQCDLQTNATVNYLCILANYTNINATTGAAGATANQFGQLTASAINSDATRQIVKSALQNAANNAIDSLYPSQRYMVVVPMAVGTIVAFITSLYLATTYLPSVTSTTMKLRSGVIPTLRDKDFHRFRVAPDQVTILIGSMFWGTFISSVVVGGIVGLVIFLFLWQVTIYFVQRFVAIVAGIILIILIRLVMVLFCRCTLFKAFYRRRPAAANISSLALECANFALSVGYVFLRMVKLLVAAGVFIGRIDTPFLAPGVGRVGNIELDNYPYIYLKDILASEAHRHPYIETMGVMYLMKLRYGDHFGKSPGSCWRLIFVYALMPWLHRYRILARPELLKSSSSGEMQPNSLNFISVRNIYSHVDDEDGDDICSNHEDMNSAGDNLGKVSAKETDEPTIEMTGEHEDDEIHKNIETDQQAHDRRITELENENEQLKAKLLAMQSGPGTTSTSEGETISNEPIDKSESIEVSV